MLRAHGWIRDLENKEKKKLEKKYSKIDKKFLFTNIGYNIRGSEIGAAIGLIQLKKLKRIISIRRKIGKFWKKHFKNNDVLSIQKETINSEHSWFGIPIYLKRQNPKLVKKLRKLLDKNNIETRPIICGNITVQPAMKKLKYKISGKLENSNYIMKNSFAIGCHQNITKDNLLYAKKIIEKSL